MTSYVLLLVGVRCFQEISRLVHVRGSCPTIFGATVFAQGSLRWSSLLLYLVVREVAMGDDLDSITKSHSRSLRRISRSSLTQECATERRM